MMHTPRQLCRNHCMGALLALLLGQCAIAQDIDFQRDVQPVLAKHCWSCHGEDVQESGLRLDRRTNLLRGGDSGLPAMVPGDPQKSYLIELVTHQDDDAVMPQSGERLSADEIDLLTRWIEQGAPWPGQMEVEAREKSAHWSFQPIVRPPVPAREAESANPIDAFLLRKLTEQGLSYSAPADPRALVRRASLVLTGLPPTPRQTATFIEAYGADPDGAYSALVERLMASPHFGERWAQHWLDVIRWAETNGSESNLYRKNAWVYRDYVIRAFNEDKPYDRFLLEQLAGDTVAAGEATGYLVAGPHVPVATVGQEPTARRQARADRMDEIVQTIGASALGLTVGCARCHNHKFDPITIRDYYCLTAVFQDVEFGARIPELPDEHRRSSVTEQLNAEVQAVREKLMETGPWLEDWTGYQELHFPAVEASAVRITFAETENIRLDELEILSSDKARDNVALAANVRCTPDISIPRFPVDYVNDGRFGTDAWIAQPTKTDGPAWVHFSFDEARSIDCLRFSTNREDFFETDYLKRSAAPAIEIARVEVQTGDGPWRQVLSSDQLAQLDQTQHQRQSLSRRLRELSEQLNTLGLQPSFVGRFIEPAKTFILGRGSPEDPRDEVSPAGIEELGIDLGLEPDASGSDRRRAFADWMVADSNPLTARVAANRLWHHVFGQGIVSTTSDFGSAGAEPTHPELLDWLAAELRQPSTNPTGEPSPPPWSMKHLIRLMVLSDAFRQGNLSHERGLNVDADAALLWRYPPRRVEAEIIRDSILRASGSLDLSLGGPSYRIHDDKERYAQWVVADNYGPDTWRRMIYQERMRRVDDQMFTAFDFPDCGQVRAKRPTSTTPLQALNLLNSEFVVQQAALIAERARSAGSATDGQAVTRCFRLLLGRTPSEDELDACLRMTHQHDLALVCRALINSNEFVFLP